MKSGTKPISISPYHMAFAKLKQLKKRLQDLFNKGFIRPSVSLLGAQILFVNKKDRSMRMYWLQTSNIMTVKKKYPLQRIDDLFD